MANTNQSLFTKPLIAGTYIISDASSACGLMISNDESSSADITYCGTGKIQINDSVSESEPIPIKRGCYEVVAADAPLELTIVVPDGATGSLVVIK